MSDGLVKQVNVKLMKIGFSVSELPFHLKRLILNNAEN